jgi:hypothetical protein
MTEAIGRVLNAAVDLRGPTINEHALGGAISGEIFERLFGTKFPSVDSYSLGWLRTEKSEPRTGWILRITVDPFRVSRTRREKKRLEAELELLARLCAAHQTKLVTVDKFSRLDDARACERQVRKSLSLVLGDNTSHSGISIQY